MTCLKLTGRGGISWTHKAQTKKRNTRHVFMWRVHGNDACDILEEIYPWLVSKQPQADIISEISDLKSVRLCRGTQAYTVDEIEYILKLQEELKALHHVEHPTTEYLINKMNKKKEEVGTWALNYEDLYSDVPGSSQCWLLDGITEQPEFGFPKGDTCVSTKEREKPKKKDKPQKAGKRASRTRHKKRRQR